MYRSIPADANRVIEEWIAAITNLNPMLVDGVYITGSIALNDYQPGKSDIDFIVLCKTLPNGHDRLQLEKIHRNIKYKFQKENLSGFYITAIGLNVHQADSTRTVCYNEERIYESAFEMAPVTLYELKSTAVTVYGIPSAALSISVDLLDIQQFLLTNINTYWKRWVATHSGLHKRGVLLVLFPRLTEWVILGLARQLFTLRAGSIISKSGAGYYCTEHLPCKYHAILFEAIKVRNEKGRHFFTMKSSSYLQCSFKRARETIACSNYIIQLFNEEFIKKHRISDPET